MATTRTNTQLVKLLGLELGVDKDISNQNYTRYSQAIRQENIDEARREIAFRRDLRFLEAKATISVTEGAAEYALESDWLRPYYAYYLDGNGDKQPLSFITYNEWEDLYADNTASDYAAPEHIAIYGNYYYVGPPADASYTINVRYFKLPADGGAADDLESFGWEAVKAYAKAYGADYLGEPEAYVARLMQAARRKLNIFASSEKRGRWSARPLQRKTSKG